MKNLFSKSAKEYKRMMNYIMKKGSFKNQKPQDIKDIESFKAEKIRNPHRKLV